MKFLILLVLLLAVIFGSCSRFEHDFAPREVIDFSALLFLPLNNAFEQITPTELGSVMDFYADDYLHYGIGKDTREEYYQNLFSVSSTLDFVVTMINAEELTEDTAIASWNLKVYIPDTKTLIADSTFVNERLEKRAGRWLLLGNGVDGQISMKQRVVIEYFTYLGCPNCPLVEERIRQLQSQFPTQLSYIEYHTSGALSFGNSHQDLMVYYTGFPSPVSIIQGSSRIQGSTPETLNLYSSLVSQLTEVEAQVLLKNFTYSTGSQIINASIKIEPQGEGFDQTNLRLRYVLIKKLWNFADPSADPHHNIALAKGSMDISSHNLDQPISFDLAYSGELPTDAALIVMVQKYPAVFASNANIYNAIEVPVSGLKR